MPCGGCQERRKIARNIIGHMRNGNMKQVRIESLRMAASARRDALAQAARLGIKVPEPDKPPQTVRIRPDVVEFYHLDKRPKK